MTELTPEQKATIERIVSARLAEIKSQTDELTKKLNHAYSDLALGTVAGIIVLNKNLTALQKSQICAILDGPKRDLTYLG